MKKPSDAIKVPAIKIMELEERLVIIANDFVTQMGFSNDAAFDVAELILEIEILNEYKSELEALI